jgi:trans-2-enoyl-CoA reductase
MTTYLGAPAAVVGTTAPQARRLEFGFVGADSLGRVYNDAPLPHFEPDLQKTADELEKAVERLLGGAVAS